MCVHNSRRAYKMFKGVKTELGTQIRKKTAILTPLLNCNRQYSYYNERNLV